jgi:hypothetical protein
MTRRGRAGCAPICSPALCGGRSNIVVAVWSIFAGLGAAGTTLLRFDLASEKPVVIDAACRGLQSDFAAVTDPLHPDVWEEMVALEDAVFFHHPVIGLRHDRLEYRGCDVRMVPRAEHVADVMELQPVYGKTCGVAAQQIQMGQDAVGNTRVKRV